jgi:hypothetical protein
LIKCVISEVTIAEQEGVSRINLVNFIAIIGRKELGKRSLVQ